MAELTIGGKVAVVTGAGRGIGRQVALAIAAAGGLVAVVARSEGELLATADQIAEAGGNAEPIVCDVADPDSVARLKEQVERALGPPAVLVNAAGIFGPITPIASGGPGWIKPLLVNAYGPYLTAAAFVPAMVEAGWGRVVNVTSAISLHPPSPLSSGYATSKVALNQLTRHLAEELEGTGVTANVLHPGDVRTEMWADIRDQAAKLGPQGEAWRAWVDWVDETGGDPPWKAAEAVLRLISDESAHLNGTFAWIDSGLQAPLASWDPPQERRPWIE